MLWTPHTSFAEVQNNLSATPALTTWGTTVTAASSTKGSWAEIFASTNFDVHWLVLAISETAVTGSSIEQTVLDIGVGASTAEQVAMSNLLVGQAPSVDAEPGWFEMSIPFYIPRGTRIAGRAQSETNNKPIRVAMWLFGGPEDVWPRFSRIDDYGVTPPNGTTHTPGSTGTESSWANIGSTTSRNYDAIMFLAQVPDQSNVLMYYFEFGYSSTTLGEVLVRSGAGESQVTNSPTPAFVQVPSGTQLQVRGECSGAPQNIQVALYGLC